VERAAVIARALVVFALAGAAAAATPTFDEVRSAYRASDAVLLDRHGVAIGGARVDASVRKLDWVALDAMSPALVAAVVAAEDKRFWEHDGVDWTGMAVAAWDSAWRIADGRRPRGGSTLTMQLAGLVDPALRAPGGETRTFARNGTRRAPRWISSARGASATSSRPTST
jgi:penicillin-binding protein 1C